MAQTLPAPSTSCPRASQAKRREEAQAKSRTRSAWNSQVCVPVGSLLRLASASSGVMMKVGASASHAVSRRSRQAGSRTSSGFCSTPVDATTWSSGTVMRTW